MTRKSQPKILGAGLISLDLVLSSDPDIPARDCTGGTCGNVMAILALFGWAAYPIARLNGDPASIRVKSDLMRWGVKLDFAECEPTTDTPIIVQEIRRARDGSPRHRFIWACPSCGKRLPAFKPITRASVESISPYLEGTSVFFFDRLSRGSLTLAKQASDDGAVVIFEPSGKGNLNLFEEAVQLSHIVKYSNQRLARIEGAMATNSNTLVEIQTLGASGLQNLTHLTVNLTTFDGKSCDI